jgi:hypothetical protein
MTLCPVALAVHCVGCPIVNVCPAKTVIGDYGRYRPASSGEKPRREPKRPKT